MAVYVPLEEFAELNAALEPAFEAARAMAEKQGIMPESTTPEDIALELESQAMLFMLQAVSKQSPLTDAAQFFLFGSFIGVIMAQSQAPHAELWRLCREQVKRSFDSVLMATQPMGSA